MNRPYPSCTFGVENWSLFIWSKQITKCNLVFNDELFHVHAY